jgi:hypothetical protein
MRIRAEASDNTAPEAGGLPEIRMVQEADPARMGLMDKQQEVLIPVRRPREVKALLEVGRHPVYSLKRDKPEIIKRLPEKPKGKAAKAPAVKLRQASLPTAMLPKAAAG